MIIWLLYLLPALAFTALCYLTNPFVVLLADEEGELDGIWHYWQTWDDSLDSEFFMKNICPAWLNYGYDEHYLSYCGTDDWTAEYGKTRTFSILRTGTTWTRKQRIQRYFCRVWWLYRNTAYGFMFYILGADMINADYKLQEQDKFYCTTGKYFCYKNEQLLCSFLRWKIYLGWKTYPGQAQPQRCMFAYRLFISLEV